jgi:predicted nucleic acid-binding Zn ribbon protein
MAEYSVGDALKRLIEQSGWGDKMYEYRLQSEWEKIVGVTISRYTNQIQLRNKILVISTDVGPLKQELILGKENLLQKVNTYFGTTIVLDLIIR